MSGEGKPDIDLIASALSAVKKDIEELYKMVEELKKLQKVNN
jgi:hypothetical protein